MRSSPDRTGQELPMLEADECKKTLGGLANPGLHHALDALGG